MNILEIKDLHVSVEGKEILKGLSLTLELGKINALMGPNGSGKSTLANTLMGHPKTPPTLLISSTDNRMASYNKSDSVYAVVFGKIAAIRMAFSSAFVLND